MMPLQVVNQKSDYDDMMFIIFQIKEFLYEMHSFEIEGIQEWYVSVYI